MSATLFLARTFYLLKYLFEGLYQLISGFYRVPRGLTKYEIPNPMGSMTTTMKYCFIQGRTQSCRLYLYVGSEYSDISK